MNKRNELTILYDIYGLLLTSNERKCFEYYYFDDYSLNEIAELINTSKAYVSKVINKIESKLLNFESILLIKNKNDKLYNLMNEINNSELTKKIEEIIEM